MFIPTLFRKVPKDYRIIEEVDDYVITRDAGFTEMEPLCPWNDILTRKALQRGVDSLRIGDASADPKVPYYDLSFLQNLPDTKAVYINMWPTISGWPLLEALKKLVRFTGLKPSGTVVQGIDFTKLGRLKECRITWNRQWQSVLNHETLVSLHVEKFSGVFFSAGKCVKNLVIVKAKQLREIDASLLRRLEALTLMECPKVQINFNELSRSLRGLLVGGTIGFSLEEIAKLKNLELLVLNKKGVLESLAFAEKLRNLKEIRIGVETKLGEKARKTMREMTGVKIV